jgi:hypothetical protein
MCLSYVAFDVACSSIPSAFARSSQTTQAKLNSFFDLPVYVTENSLSQSLSIITGWYRSEVLLARQEFYRILLTITEPDVDSSGHAV